MSRTALAMFVGLGVSLVAGRTAVASPKISTSDVTSARELRAGATEVITHELARTLAGARCDRCHVDASVTRLVAEQTAEGTAITADLHITVSDERGVVISMVASTSRAVARREKLSTLRDEALHGAIASASPKVTRVLAARPVIATVPVTRFALK